jgi:hypothetical protein
MKNKLNTCMAPINWLSMCQLRFIISILFLFVASVSFAQEQGEIEKVEIEIIKDKQITLGKAERNFEKVPPRPVEPIKPEITYEFKSLPFTAPSYNPILRPLKLKAEPISKIYGNYASGAFGNYSSPLIEAYFTNKRDKNKFYGAKVFHHSFGSGPVDNSNSASGSTEIKVFGRVVNRAVAVGGFLSYENWNSKFYGELPGVFKGSAATQSYIVYSLGADIANGSPADFDYQLRGGYSYLKDNFNSTENEVSFNFTSSYKMTGANKIILQADYHLLSRKYDVQESRTRHLFKVRPAYQFSPIENLTLTIGVNTAFQNDTLGTVKSINVYPHIMGTYELTESIQAYAGLTGDMDKVSLQGISRETSWIDQNVLLNHTNRTAEFLGGLKGKFSKVAFQTGISVANLKNLYFYQNNAIKSERFVVTYDQGNTQRINLFAELGLSTATKFKAQLRADYFGYSTDKITEAWHKPTYRIGAMASYNVYNKILLDIDLILQGGMKASAIDQSQIGAFKTVTIGAAADLNLKATYLVSDQFSVFLKANNILNNQYQVYLYYPVRGFQAMAGLSWSF